MRLARTAATVLTVLGAGLLIQAAQAQGTSRWIAGQTPGVCGMLTNNSLQDIPSAGFGVSAESRSEFSLLIRGYMNHDGEPIKKAAVQFGSHTEAASKIGFSKIEEPNLYGMALTLDTVHLARLADEPSFTIFLDGERFATYTLADRGPMVVAMARCMRGLP